MELEFELETLAEDLIKKQIESHQNLCPVCNSQLKGNICTECGEEVPRTREYYFDPDFDEYAENLERESREFFESQKWEEVPDDAE